MRGEKSFYMVGNLEIIGESLKVKSCQSHHEEWVNDGANLCQHVPAVCIAVQRQVFAQDFDGVLFEDGRGVDGALDRWHGLHEDAVHKDHSFFWGGPWNTHTRQWTGSLTSCWRWDWMKPYRAARACPSASVPSGRHWPPALWSALRPHTAPSSQTAPESGRGSPPLSLRNTSSFSISDWYYLCRRWRRKCAWIWSVQSLKTCLYSLKNQKKKIE